MTMDASHEKTETETDYFLALSGNDSAKEPKYRPPPENNEIPKINLLH